MASRGNASRYWRWGGGNSFLASYYVSAVFVYVVFLVTSFVQDSEKNKHSLHSSTARPGSIPLNRATQHTTLSHHNGASRWNRTSNLIITSDALAVEAPQSRKQETFSITAERHAEQAASSNTPTFFFS